MELAEGLGVGLGPSGGVVVWWCGGVVVWWSSWRIVNIWHIRQSMNTG